MNVLLATLVVGLFLIFSLFSPYGLFLFFKQKIDAIKTKAVSKGT